MQTDNNAIRAIREGETCLGIEFGSTRIKAVLTSADGTPLAMGSHGWENKLVDGIWTYDADEIIAGLQDCYKRLAEDVQGRYGEPLKTAGAIGISAMMHGYMAFGADDRLLVPFRTWRNTITGEAAEKLSALFNFNIPQRWSIAHLYQAVLNGEEHVKDIRFITTLAGYMHWLLTGEKVLGAGDASGMFPIDSVKCDYNARMLKQFDSLVADKQFPWTLSSILPRVLPAGERAGKLTQAGARLLDPSGALLSGIPCCPPEGDAGTGMAATNAISPKTGNVSAGTSVFAMVVLEKELSRLYPEIDMVTTPDGAPVAMVHCNNCSSDLDAWVGLFKEAAAAFGVNPDADTLYTTLYRSALSGDADCGGLFACNYYSGEPVTGFTEGRPLFARMPDSRLTLGNFMRAHLYSALGALKVGMDILLDNEHVSILNMTGHGGFFKVEGVGQRVMAAALNTPVTVMATAGEGGPWGMALLAGYMNYRKPQQTLGDYLQSSIFGSNDGASTVAPDTNDVKGFNSFMELYRKGMDIERAAVSAMK